MAVLDGYFQRENGGEMKVETLTSIKQLRQDIEYHLYTGTQSNCLQALQEHFPWFSDNPVYWIAGTNFQGQLWVPMAYDGEKPKAAP